MRHGVNGWDLTEYDWNPATGVATLVYDHDSGVRNTRTVQRECWTPGEDRHVAGRLVARGPTARA